MEQTPPVTEMILQRCRELGFARAGIARAEPTGYEKQLRAWLAAGHHGEMDYLNRHEELLIYPTRLVEGAKSIICVADYHGEAVERTQGHSKPGRPRPRVRPDTQKPPEIGGDESGTTSSTQTGRIARYAQGDDYHPIIKKRLHLLCDEIAAQHEDETFKACVDTAPLLEREHAQRAGLGSVGKNTLLIEPGRGSYFFLGEIITTLDLKPTESTTSDPCGTCTRCIDACPTNAITPFSVDATRCISYLTIEHRSAISTEFFTPMANWIFGCDICQEVCPHNQSKSRGDRPQINEAYAPRRDGFDLLEILNWSEDDRRTAFTKSAMKRARLAMMKRNALIAAGNALAVEDVPEIRAKIASIASDAEEDPLVRETANDVLAHL